MLLGHGHTASPDAIGALTFHGFSSIRLLLYATLLLVKICWCLIQRLLAANCQYLNWLLLTNCTLQSGICRTSSIICRTSSVTTMCKVLPTWLFKLCADELMPFLYRLFNWSFTDTPHQGHLRLFCCMASALQHPSFSQPEIVYQTSSASGPNTHDWITAKLFLLDCQHTS